MFIDYKCDGCSTAPLTQYKSNEIYQEITEREDYGVTTKDNRAYIDMRRSEGYTDALEKLTRNDSGFNFTVNLKKAAENKMRLGIAGYSQAEYWYTLSNKGYITTYKNYNISRNDEISPQLFKTKQYKKFKYIRWQKEKNRDEKEK